MKVAFVVAFICAAMAFASPLQARGTAEGKANELSAPPSLVEWGGHLIQDLWNKTELRRSAAPRGAKHLFAGVRRVPSEDIVTVTVIVTTEVITATLLPTTVPTSTAPVTTTSASATLATELATGTGSAWDIVVDETWEGDEPANITYAKPVLDAHNIHRTNHSIVNLKWNTTMEQTAKEISETCYYGHSRAAGDGNYGQNIGAGFSADNAAAMVGDAMYNDEIELYPGPYGQEPDMSDFESWGHYSQIVWKDTTDVGCWTTDCSSTGLENVASDVGPEFTVCNYYPAGNVVGEFADQVPSPGDLPVIVIPSVA